MQFCVIPSMELPVLGEKHACFQGLWYSSAWKRNIHKLLILTTLEVYFKSKMNATLLTWLGNLGTETEMCVCSESSLVNECERLKINVALRFANGSKSAASSRELHI